MNSTLVLFYALGIAMGKPSKKKAALLKRAKCMNEKLGVGVGSRIKSDIAPDSWEISGVSRGSHGQTGITVKTPSRTYNSFREAVDSECLTSERLDRSADISNTSLFEPSISINEESDASESETDSESEPEDAPEWQDELGADIRSDSADGIFVGETESIFKFVDMINATSACASSQKCTGQYIL